jgi:5-methylcytosine-specific restriction protein A
MGLIVFEAGQIYNRQRDIHDRFGGQRQGGMSTPADHSIIFLFTGESGATYGYKDEFRPDGTFWYTGEGQQGDMQFIRANRALRDHQQEGKHVHLFEAIGKGAVKYIGEAEYLGHHFEERPDIKEGLRKAIIFELALITGTLLSSTQTHEPLELNAASRLGNKTLDELRRFATEGINASASTKERRRNVYVRSEAVRAYVLKRAEGRCEGCDAEAPFKTKRGQPYLEPHHTRRLADGGPDHPAHVIALCPTCHRRVHHAQDGEEYNERLMKWLEVKEGKA